MIPLHQHTIKYKDVPTVVDVDIMIRSMGPISESDMVRDNDNNNNLHLVIKLHSRMSSSNQISKSDSR